MLRKTLLGAAFAASLLGLGATAAHAQIYVQIAPPPPLHEPMPAARPGHVWAEGHYEWRGGQYVWVPGRWLEARQGWEYREPRWVQRANGQWYMVGGNWERADRYASRDDDGYHDRRDRSRRFGPFGDLDRDGIQNRDDRDRDGDGVRNRRDRFPDNWRRS
jgi:hypothetical protein